MREPTSTAARTLVSGQVIRRGTGAPYLAIAEAPGERHGLRGDLVPGGRVGSGEHILRLAHLTDLHVADAQSPLRLDFAAKTAAERPGWGGSVTYTFRPHELLTSHAATAMANSLGRLGLDLTVVTGDNVDNAQLNEIDTYLSVLDGGTVRPVSADGAYEGPQSLSWGDSWYWVPADANGRYQELWGYPTIAAFTSIASTPFRSAGIGTPWLACLGNHDALVGGATAITEELSRIATGNRKPIALPADVPAGEELEIYLREPALLFSGQARDVKPDETRRLADTSGFIAAHLARTSGPGPVGHGFSPANHSAGTGYYRYDPAPGVRIYVLDTNHRRGMWDGNMNREQLEWLTDELESSCGPDGPVIILASHHGTPSLGNTFDACAGDGYAADLLDVALGCPNVVLWLNGHLHANRVVAHHRPGGGGLFEVTTASMTDYPTQARVLEVVRQNDGVLRVTSTIYDHDSPLNPEPDASDVANLAALHRQLAANEVWRGFGRSGLGGMPADRNVHMLVP